MTKVLSLRVPASLMVETQSRAARLGMDRSQYLRDLIERDLAAAKKSRRHKFASENLLGALSLGKGPYTNERVRELTRERDKARRERNR